MRKDIEGFEPRLQAFEDNLAEHSNKLWDSQDQMKARLDICEKRVEAVTQPREVTINIDDEEIFESAKKKKSV